MTCGTSAANLPKVEPGALTLFWSAFESEDALFKPICGSSQQKQKLGSHDLIVGRLKVKTRLALPNHRGPGINSVTLPG